ncbi:MAG: S9 family peptidase [Gemmatimonadota bacterium]|nr:S9 family peptidase [Gemmatimonadota bacterium]
MRKTTNGAELRGKASLLGLAVLSPAVLGLSACVDAEEDFTRYEADVFFETVSYGLAGEGGHAFSPDGSRLLINSDETGVFNAYALDIATRQAEPLSDSESNAIFAVSWFPDDDRVLLTGDVGGNEHNSVFVRDPDGTLHDLLPPGDYEVAGQQSGLRFEAWQEDGEAFFLTSTERDPQLADLYRYDAETYERERVFRNTRDRPFPTRGFHVSPDGRWLSLDFHHTRYDFDIYLVDLHSEERQPELILSHDEEVVYRGMGFTPDSRRLIYGTDEHGEFMDAWTYDLETGETAPLVVADWDITQTRTNLDYGITYSPDGRYRVDIHNVDARNEVSVTDTRSEEELDLSFLPDGMVSSPRFEPGTGRLAVELERDTRPTDVFLLDLEARSAERLTEALNPAVAEAHLVESEVVRFESYDGLEIPGLLYRPHEASAETPAPAMVWVHGGPGAQSRQGYSPVIQFLVNQGYAIYAINNRGSKGYGRTFREMDRRKHGEADLGDVVASRGYLESIDWIDDDRIGVMGASFGGYLTLAAMTFEPEVFDVGISIVGYSDVIGNITAGGWRLPRLPAAYDEMGHPEEDAERLRRVSPLYAADRIARPLFVAAGANDVRVPIDQNDRLVEAAREAGVDVEYLVFEDEGHGFRKRENRITAAEAYVDFLDRFLRGEGM